ncbi:MAG TPA: DEAD/DEAH box helicase [Methanofastidiosum sp.]|nr:DEAD/DEAH box helicase [Methanofastidiosum sp.]HNU61393.1 DEAD/DEAH box helicase [Methanofastidiosum sp.]
MSNKTNDIILILDWEESYTVKKMVIEVFIGKNKILKSKTFSGPLRKYLFEFGNIPDNISEMDYNNLIEILFDNKNIQNTKNKFLIDDSNFNKFFELIKKYNFFYYKKDKKNKINLISGIGILNEIHSLVIKSKIIKDKALFTFELDNQKIDFEKKSAFFSFDEYNFMISENEIYFIDKYIDAMIIDRIIENNNCLSLTHYVPLLPRIITIENEIYFRKEKEEYEIVYGVTPITVFYLNSNYENKNINGKLYFSYDSEEIESCYKNDHIYDITNKRKIIRNKKTELDAIEILKNNNWKHSLNNTYYHENNNELINSLYVFIEKGWKLLTEKKENIKILSHKETHISYGIDWFDLKVNYNEDNVDVSIIEILKNIKKNKPWIELGEGNLFIIPKEINNNRNLLNNSKIENQNIKIKKKYVGSLKILLEDLDPSQIKKIDSILDFNSIQIDLEEHFCGVLRDYQLIGIKWLTYLYLNKLGGCLSDDMGLGKTIQVLGLLSQKKIKQDLGICLIVVPKTLIFNWVKEIGKFSPNLKYLVYHGLQRENILQDINKVDIVLTTYGTLRNDIEKFEEIKTKILILDEAQNIKNFKSLTYRELNKLDSDNRFILTGTPIENNLKELWGLMNFLNRGILGSYKTFENQFINKDDINLKQLKIKISPFVLRRTKKEVLKELPEKIEQEIFCEMEDCQRLLYDTIKAKFRNDLNTKDNRYLIKDSSRILEGLLYLRQICCHPALLRKEYNVYKCDVSGKFIEMKEIVTEIKESGNKIIIFSQFTSMLKIIEKWLIKKEWKYFYLDGKTNNREKIVEDFENSNEGIFLISLKAGGFGLNLVSANYVIIYDPWWNPSVENQAADRVYRIGQLKNVNIYRLITLDSIEEKIIELKNIKLELCNNLLEGQEKILEISIEDLRSILID